MRRVVASRSRLFRRDPHDDDDDDDDDESWEEEEESLFDHGMALKEEELHHTCIIAPSN
jgi:hypothetical protein